MADDSADSLTSTSRELKSVNRVLATLVVLTAGWALLGTWYNVARYAGVLLRFRQVKVQVPSLPLLLTDYPAVFFVLVIAGTAGCVWRTFRRPDRRSTVYGNVAGIILLFVWWVLHTTVFYTTVAAVIEFSVPTNP
jgi:hypothetical protein